MLVRSKTVPKKAAEDAHMTTNVDEIVEEIRRHREAHAASLNYDLKRIIQDLQRQEQESGTEVVKRLPRKPLATPGPSSSDQLQ